ncbi:MULTISPECIES: hypothetical protein [unclassified Psychrobacter]|uniref:CDI toxin immunity protein n=1 Tax=unclassified Psychrobacter TaxID=196806 RepID=UPI0025F42D5C|nr:MULTISPECIES: hypothetical protein [unclassified Psychrobacter]
MNAKLWANDINSLSFLGSCGVLGNVHEVSFSRFNRITLNYLKKFRVLADEESRKVTDQFISSFPIRTSGSGGIDWNKVDRKVLLTCIEEIKNQITFTLTDSCFVIWNDAAHPVVATTVENIVKAFDDVTAVSFDTWIFIPRNNNVIESTPSSLRMTTFFTYNTQPF